jgi:hypothetical protein
VNNEVLLDDGALIEFAPRTIRPDRCSECGAQVLNALIDTETLEATFLPCGHPAEEITITETWTE